MRRITAIAVLTILGLSVNAQESAYRWEAGVSGGISGYLGDYNKGNPFARPGGRLSVEGGYLLDARWSFRLTGGVSGISGNSDDASGELPNGVPSHFRSTLGDLTMRAEFNFFAYGEGETFKHLSRWTPYIAAGAGMVVASPRGCGVKAAPLLPLALGVKYRIRSRLNLTGEFSLSKSFTDNLDGNSDLYGIKGSRFKNTDWFSTLTVGISYEFGERCPTCHYFD